MKKLEGELKQLSEAALKKSRAAFEKTLQSKYHQVCFQKPQTREILFKKIKISLKNEDHANTRVLVDELNHDLAAGRNGDSDSELFCHPEFPQYLDQLSSYISMAGHEKNIRLWPCLEDKNSVTPLDPYYFYQDTWAARMIFKIRPKQVVDIGSTALLVGIVSQFVPTTSIDIRPLPIRLPGLTCQRGSITNLPFDDASIEFVCSMCVIEHIGLGRYGDNLDSRGSIKALKEISRVIKAGGYFLFSVPISHTPRVDFNAHRVFSKQQILELLPGFEIKEELFLFPHPGKEPDLARLNSGQFGIWCALCRHV